MASSEISLTENLVYIETAERREVNTALQKLDRARRRQRLASKDRTTLVLTSCARQGEGEARLATEALDERENRIHPQKYTRK